MNVCIRHVGIGGRRSETQTAHRHQTGRAAGSPGCARLSRAEPEVRGTDSPEARVHARELINIINNSLHEGLAAF
jgi:hypothetical protein